MPIYTGLPQDNIENLTLSDQEEEDKEEHDADEEHSDNEADDGNDEDESESESDDDEKESPWREIMEEACDNVKLESAEGVLFEPYLSEFVEAMKNAAEERFSFVRQMEQDSGYEMLSDTIEKYEHSDGYEKEEAIDAAWHARRFLVKQIIIDNIDVLEDWLNRRDKEDTDDEDEGDGDEDVEDEDVDIN